MNEKIEWKMQGITKWFTCFLIGFSKMLGAFSLVKIFTRGSLFADTNSSIPDLVN